MAQSIPSSDDPQYEPNHQEASSLRKARIASRYQQRCPQSQADRDTKATQEGTAFTAVLSTYYS